MGLELTKSEVGDVRLGARQLRAVSHFVASKTTKQTEDKVQTLLMLGLGKPSIYTKLWCESRV